MTFAEKSSPGIPDLTSGTLSEIDLCLDFSPGFSSFSSSLNLDLQTVTYGKK
jgi:hypothetical protein